MHKFTMTLTSFSDLVSGEIRHFCFKLEPAIDFNFKAGQFISLHIASKEGELRRNYSIALAPNTNNDHDIAIACRYIKGGCASEKLFNMQVGDSIVASGPYGRFILPDKKIYKRYILVATGTGVTPYLSMLPMLTNWCLNDTAQVVLLFGCRTRKHVLYKDEFLAAAQSSANFTYLVSYSRETKDDTCVDFERFGYVQDHFKDLNLMPENDLAYLCGNPEMVDIANKSMLESGMSQHNIVREKYLAGKQPQGAS